MEARDIVGLLTPMLSIIFAGAFAIVWHANPKLKHIAHLSLAYGLVAVSCLIAWLFYKPAPALSLYVSSGLIIISLVIFSMSLFSRQKINGPINLQIALTILALLTTAYALFVVENIGLHFMLVSLITCVQSTIVALYIHNTKKTRLSERSIVIIIAVLVAGLLSHMIVFFLPALSEMKIDTYQDSDYWLTICMLTIVLSSALAINLIILTINDATNAVRKIAATDELSRLWRRGEFERRASAILDDAKSSGIKVALVIADIDHFKIINDKYGHQAGDIVIRRFGVLLKSMVHEGDIAGRIGGEEFAILLRNSDDVSTRLFAEQLRSSFEAIQFGDELGNSHFTSSFGIAQMEPEEVYHMLFAKADIALYRAKDLGRNKVYSDRSHANFLASKEHQGVFEKAS